MVTVSTRFGRGQEPSYFVIKFNGMRVFDHTQGPHTLTPEAYGVLGRISLVFPGVRFTHRNDNEVEMLPSRYNGSAGLITAEKVEQAANGTITPMAA